MNEQHLGSTSNGSPQPYRCWLPKALQEPIGSDFGIDVAVLLISNAMPQRRPPGSLLRHFVIQIEGQMFIGPHEFKHICAIEPETTAEGSIREIMPQSRYNNRENLRLNRYGSGPFCSFRIPNHHTHSGVYAVIVADEVKYIGECQNLSDRFNMGYGTISPRNCFTGGQETNCRINHLILTEAKKRKALSLWFLRCQEYKVVEQKLRDLAQPEWNKR